MRVQGYCDVYKWTILKRTSPEVKCLHPTSSRREMFKFSHGTAFYTLYGKTVNVMLESKLMFKEDWGSFIRVGAFIRIHMV